MFTHAHISETAMGEKKQQTLECRFQSTECICDLVAFLCGWCDFGMKNAFILLCPHEIEAFSFILCIQTTNVPAHMEKKMQKITVYKTAQVS